MADTEAAALKEFPEFPGEPMSKRCDDAFDPSTARRSFARAGTSSATGARTRGVERTRAKREESTDHALMSSPAVSTRSG